jgi:DNA-directed RNA polymerase subunit RPC12/RpoP
MLSEKQKRMIQEGVLGVPQLLACLMLLWALKPHNAYSYYILLRWVCFTVFGFLALRALLQQKPGWICVLGVTALVYNPIVRLHLTRDLWSIINVATIGIAVASFFALRVKGEKGNATFADASFSTPRVIPCNNCGQKLRVPAMNAELEVRCPSCGNKFLCPPQSP